MNTANASHNVNMGTLKSSQRQFELSCFSKQLQANVLFWVILLKKIMLNIQQQYKQTNKTNNNVIFGKDIKFKKVKGKSQVQAQKHVTMSVYSKSNDLILLTVVLHSTQLAKELVTICK